MDCIKDMMEVLEQEVKYALKNIDKVNTHELGEIIDMIKDLAEAAYYCSMCEEKEERGAV